MTNTELRPLATCRTCWRRTRATCGVCGVCRGEEYQPAPPGRPTVEEVAARQEVRERVLREEGLKPNRATGGQADDVLDRRGVR